MSQPRFNLFSYKKFLVDRKSIRQEKDRGKEKRKSKVKGTNGVFFSIQKKGGEKTGAVPGSWTMLRK
jgi:hypothetical protein